MEEKTKESLEKWTVCTRAKLGGWDPGGGGRSEKRTKEQVERSDLDLSPLHPNPSQDHHL